MEQLLSRRRRAVRSGAGERSVEYTQLDADAYRERTVAVAKRLGLPPVGATMTNAFGIEWVIQSHDFASSVVTMGKLEGAEDPLALYPVSIPQNLSPRLTEMLESLNLCTPKSFVPFDTVPELRHGLAAPYHHSVDSASDPSRVLLFLDCARLPECVLAHELGHVWIDLVDDLEDHRVLIDTSDPVRYGQVQIAQSFVMDRLVNRLLLRRGFDISQIEIDSRRAISQLTATASNGYQPEGPWERVGLAMVIAEEVSQLHDDSPPALSTNNLRVVQDAMPDVWSLSCDLSAILESSHLDTKEGAIDAIDRVLALSFAFAGEHLDIEADLMHLQPAVEWRWSFPGSSSIAGFVGRYCQNHPAITADAVICQVWEESGGNPNETNKPMGDIKPFGLMQYGYPFRGRHYKELTYRSVYSNSGPCPRGVPEDGGTIRQFSDFDRTDPEDQLELGIFLLCNGVYQGQIGSGWPGPHQPRSRAWGTVTRKNHQFCCCMCSRGS